MKIVLDGLHRDYWQNNNPEVVGENVCYSYCLKNPDTGGRSPKHKRAGAIGKIVRLFDGRVAVMESRTVEPWCDISPDADYWKRLQVSDEISDLVLAAHEAGYLVDSVLLDVTCTPGLRPGKATPEHQRKYTADGRLFANMRVDDESPEDYAARVYEAVVADPGRYFRREEIVRLPADLLEHQRRLWATRCGL